MALSIGHDLWQHLNLFMIYSYLSKKKNYTSVYWEWGERILTSRIQANHNSLHSGGNLTLELK